MNSPLSVDLKVYPDDCDASGRVHHASFVRLFERAHWDVVSRGPGMDVFARSQTCLAVRKASVEYHAGAFVGDVLSIDVALTHHGKTSFTLHETARRREGGEVVAEGDFVFVVIDQRGRPRPVPGEIARLFGRRPSVRPGGTQHLAVRGCALAVDILGDGPAILFVHGFPLDRTMWRHLAATLTGWRRIAPDLRGMGLSDLPPERFEMADYADDLAALLDVLHSDRAVICGLSMGGYVALEFVRRHSDRVRALILLNTRALADDAGAKGRRDELIGLVEREGTDALAEQMVPKLLAPASLTSMPRVVDHVHAMTRGSPPDGLTAALRAMRDRADSTDLLASINVPTLVVAGSNDAIVSVKESKAMAAAIPGAQFVQIPQAGHLPPLEQPIALSRVIAEFLESLG